MRRWTRFNRSSHKTSFQKHFQTYLAQKWVWDISVERLSESFATLIRHSWSKTDSGIGRSWWSAFCSSGIRRTSSWPKNTERIKFWPTAKIFMEMEKPFSETEIASRFRIKVIYAISTYALFQLRTCKTTGFPKHCKSSKNLFSHFVTGIMIPSLDRNLWNSWIHATTLKKEQH